jgi:carboxymethylenebutenolidase
MDPRAIELYNDYVHGDMPRRDFLARLAGILGSAAAVSALLPLLEPRYAQAQQVAGDDARIETSNYSYPGSKGDVRAYVARPRSVGKRAGVLVIHENRGLNAHIEDVARRFALAGYLAVAPDGLSVAGGAPEDQEKARDLFNATDRATIDADVIAGVGYLAGREDCSGKIGTVGFCYGGGIALRCAAERPEVSAAVCFYGSALDEAQLATVKAPLLLHYAGTDERINSGIEAFRAALDRRGVAYSLNMYPGTQHGFHNDASAARYDAAAATLAWERTLAFFARTLAG